MYKIAKYVYNFIFRNIKKKLNNPNGININLFFIVIFTENTIANKHINMG